MKYSYIHIKYKIYPIYRDIYKIYLKIYHLKQVHLNIDLKNYLNENCI